MDLTKTFELVSSSGDLMVKIWRIEDDKLKHIKDLDIKEACSFLIRDKKMVCCAKNGLKKFDLNTGESINVLNTKFNNICIQ